MSIAELQNRIDGKNRCFDELSEKIIVVVAEIAGLAAEINHAVSSGALERAIELTRAKRDKEDEVEIHRQVAESIQAVPAVTPGEICNAWDEIADETKTRFIKAILPELDEAYKRYVESVESLEFLCCKIKEKAATLKQFTTETGQDGY